MGLSTRKFPKPRHGAIENRGSKACFSRPIRGLSYFTNINPTVGTVGYYHTLLRSFNLWRTRLPIC